MKNAITPAYVFNPTNKTLDLSMVPGFDIKKLYGVINQTTGRPLFISGSNEYKLASLTGGVLTFSTSTSGAASNDSLLIIYDEAVTSGLTDAQLRADPVIVELASGIGTVELGPDSLAALEAISVSGPLTESQLRASPVNVSLSAAPLPAGAATAALQTTGNSALAAIDSKLAGSLTVSTGLVQPLTDTQLRAAPVAVTGTFWQSTQPVSMASAPLPIGAATSALQSTGNTSLSSIDSKLSGTLNVNNGQSQPLTNTQLRASAVPVSGTFWQATQPVSLSSIPLPAGAATAALQTTGNSALAAIDSKLAGSLTVSTGLVQPLTDTQLRAAPVIVDFSSIPDVTINSMPEVNLSPSTLSALEPVPALTDTQLRSSPVPVSDGALVDLNMIQEAMQNVQNDIKTLTETLVVIAAAMVEKMPRVTGNDQMAVSIEAGAVSIANNQDLRSITGTVASLTNLAGVGTKYVSGDNMNLAGTQHIYSNIVVT